MEDTQKTKVCSKCGVEKPISEFYKNSSGRSGFRSACKLCSNKQNRKWYKDNPDLTQKYRDDRREERNSRQKEYYRENLEARKEYSRKYNDKNKEKLSQYKKEYYKKNKNDILNYRKEWYRNNSVAIRAQKKIYNGINKDTISEKQKIYYGKNRDSRIQYARYYYEKNKPEILEKSKEYRDKNSGSCRHNTARYRAILLEATPNWLTDAHIDQIKDIYNKCARIEKETGIKHHVDHIIPIRGTKRIYNEDYTNFDIKVRGLHVPCNLQILPASENKSKSCKFPEENQYRNIASNKR